MNSTGSVSQNLQGRLVLVSFAPSHYCERARWALDRTGVPYTEVFIMPATQKSTVRKLGYRPKPHATVPMLLGPNGKILGESSDIIKAADRTAADALGSANDGAFERLYPSDPKLAEEILQFEEQLGKGFGKAMRVVAYSHLLFSSVLYKFFSYRLPWFHRGICWLLMPFLRIAIYFLYDLKARNISRSKACVDEVFADVENRLKDGRRYLFGDRFTAADLTFASLGYALVFPPNFGGYAGEWNDTPESFRNMVKEYRNTLAGKYIMRLYAEERDARPKRALI